MNQKNGILPIILLLTFSLVLSMWVIKNVPMEPPMADREKQEASAHNRPVSTARS